MYILCKCDDVIVTDGDDDNDDDHHHHYHDDDDDCDGDHKIPVAISDGVATSVRGLWRIHTEDDTG